MAFQLSMPKLSLFGKKACLSVDIGSAAVKICRVSGGSGKYKIDFWDSLPMPPGLSGKDMETKAAELLSTLVAKHKLKQQPVIFALPAQAVVIRYLSYQGIPRDRLEGVVRHDAEGHIPFPLAEVSMDWCEARKKENGFDVLLVAIKKDKLDSTVAIIEDSGLEVQLVDVTTLALFSLYYHSALVDEKEEEVAEVFVDIGAGTTDIAFLKNQRLFFTRSVPIAGRSFTELIAKRMEVSEERAESLKIKHAEVKAIVTDITPTEAGKAPGGLAAPKGPGLAGLKPPGAPAAGGGLTPPKAPGLTPPGAAGGLTPPKPPVPGGLTPPKPPAPGGLTPPKPPVAMGAPATTQLAPPSMKPPEVQPPTETAEIPKKQSEVVLPKPPMMKPPESTMPKPPGTPVMPAADAAPKPPGLTLPKPPTPPSASAAPTAAPTAIPAKVEPPKPPSLSLPKPPAAPAAPAMTTAPTGPAKIEPPKPPSLSLPKPPAVPPPPGTLAPAPPPATRDILSPPGTLAPAPPPATPAGPAKVEPPKPPSLSLPKPPAAPPIGLPKPPGLSMPKPPGARTDESGDGKSLGAAKAEDSEVFTLFESEDEKADENVDKEKLSAAVKPIADRLATELRRSFDYFSGQLSGGEIKRVHLCGGGASLKGLAEYLSAQLNVPVIVFDPLKKVQVPESAGMPPNPQTFSAAIGMGIRILDGTPLNLNLLPENIMAMRRVRSLGQDVKRVGVAAGILLFLIGLYGYMTVYNTAELAKKLQNDIHELEPVVSRTRQLEKDQKTVNDLEKSIAALIAARANWVTVWLALDKTLPENAWVASVTMPAKNKMELRVIASSLTEIPEIGRRFQSPELTKNMFTVTNRPNPREGRTTASGATTFEVDFSLNLNHSAAKAFLQPPEPTPADGGKS